MRQDYFTLFLMMNFLITTNAPRVQQNPIPKNQGLSASFPQQLMQFMQEIRIGEYLVKSQRVSGNSIDGYSIILLNNSVVYEGEMSRSRKNGFGVEYSSKGGIIYEGYFRDDKYDGWGRTSVYTGQFRDGLYDGYGIYSIDSYYYEGFFQKAQPSGEGISFKGASMVRFHPVKNVFEFLHKGLTSASFFEDYKFEEIYLGEWKEGVKHGFGRLWRVNYWYSGQFSNDLPHGLGAEESKSGKQDKVVQTIYKLGVKK